MRIHLLLVVCFLCGLAAFRADGDAKKEKAPQRKAVAQLRSPIGTLLMRDKTSGPWALPALYDAVHTGDSLLVLPGAKAVLELQEGDVRLTLFGNLPELSAGPTLEAAAVLHGKDDIALDRGRLVLDCRKETGSVAIRIRLGASQFNLVMQGGSRVALERYSFWRPGVPFVKDKKTEEEPENIVIFMVVKGKVESVFPGERRVIEEPVIFHWHLQGQVQGPAALKKLPEWLTPDGHASAPAAAAHAAVEKVRRSIAENKEVSTLAPLLKDKDEAVRRTAVFSAGAIDEVEPVLAALSDGKPASVRVAAVLQLRHLAGRPQQERSLFAKLTGSKSFLPGEAEIFMGLLRTFGERDLTQPETYDALINYLGSERVALRELSHWHLVQIVPSGKSINFDAAAGAEQRSKGQAAWRKLIPEGKVPSREK
jgi:hypothetical protein